MNSKTGTVVFRLSTKDKVIGQREGWKRIEGAVEALDIPDVVLRVTAPVGWPQLARTDPERSTPGFIIIADRNHDRAAEIDCTFEDYLKDHRPRGTRLVRPEVVKWRTYWAQEQDRKQGTGNNLCLLFCELRHTPHGARLPGRAYLNVNAQGMWFMTIKPDATYDPPTQFYIVPDADRPTFLEVADEVFPRTARSRVMYAS